MARKSRKKPASAPLAGLSYTQIDEMVRACLPTARQIVLSGLLGPQPGLPSGETHFDAQLPQLVGHSGPDVLSDDSLKQQMEWSYGAYALGIAVGLHLDRSLFTTAEADRRR